MDHVIIRKLEHLTGSASAPALGFAIETRDRPGPVYKQGAFPDDRVWIQLHGGLIVAQARIEICWVGEYSRINEVRTRTRGSPLYELLDFWRGRAKYGFAAVGELRHEAWIDPYWAGPRTYGYEWVTLENDKKSASWLDKKEPPRSGSDLGRRYKAWRG